MTAVRERLALESQARSELLSELEVLEASIRLERIALHDKPLDYFPAPWADIGDATLVSLPYDVALALARKADRARRRPWRKLGGRLTAQIAAPPASEDAVFRVEPQTARRLASCGGMTSY
jgi:hypothetical protein